MTTNTKNNFSEDNEEVRKKFRETMEGQFEHNLYMKSSSLNLTKRILYN